jgi:hypothetical protein
LAGAEGFLVEFKNSFRLVVSITILNRSVAAELDGAWVTPENASLANRSAQEDFVPEA